MAEQMNEFQNALQERLNTGTSPTKNESFEKNGYFIIKDLWSVDELYSPVPSEKGQYNYWGKKLDQFRYDPLERQVEGSTSRYWHPQYHSIHSGIRMKLEQVIGKKLYNTYYYDRFYYPGQELTRHADRDACEISVSVHVGTNLKGKDADWPFQIKTPDIYTDKTKREVSIVGESHSLILKPGDGLLYKGCERPHWRDAMPGILPISSKKRFWNFFKKNKQDDLYYHQIFFHYVLADGIRCHCANDMAR